MNRDGVCKDCKNDYAKERLYRGKRIYGGEWFVGNQIWTVRQGDDRGDREAVLSDGFKSVVIDLNTLGEFTGAIDGKGNKIFEGDIIDHPYWVVTYCSGMKCFSGMQVGWYLQRDNWEGWMELQNTDNHAVIGNIHDNPELWRR